MLGASRRFACVELLTAGCIDTDLPAGRRNVGLVDRPLIETTHVHHAIWVMSTETRCETSVHAKFAEDPSLLKKSALG